MRRNKRILFLQITEPGAYPPLIHSSELFAEKSWSVYFLSAPIKNKTLRISSNDLIQDIRLKVRPTHEVKKWYMFYYLISSIIQVIKIRPNLIYVSDPIAALPATFASFFGLIKVIYHEHDSPNTQKDLNPFIRFFRWIICRVSSDIVFPNEKRGTIVQKELGFQLKKLKIIWNLPRTTTPKNHFYENKKLILYYHGSINRQRLPEKLFKVISEFKESVKIVIAGYEAPDSIGYIEKVRERYTLHNEQLQFLGQFSHSELIAHARKCDVGLSFMPMKSSDINMANMFGASNKVFEYMSIGLPVIVSKLNEWVNQIEDEGYGISCDLGSTKSIKECIEFFINLKLNEEYQEMSSRCVNKIKDEWNYDLYFSFQNQ